MKKAINVRLEENIIVTLEQLSQEMHTTKTEVIEKAIKLFSKHNAKQNNDLMQFAGILGQSEADAMLQKIKDDNVSKDFTVNL